jgi:hypothetical protein
MNRLKLSDPDYEMLLEVCLLAAGAPEKAIPQALTALDHLIQKYPASSGLYSIKATYVAPLSEQLKCYETAYAIALAENDTADLTMICEEFFDEFVEWPSEVLAQWRERLTFARKLAV